MQPPKQSRGATWALFGLFVLGNLLLKGWGVTVNPVALDEPFSLYHAQFSLSHIYSELTLGNTPPVYEFFLHYWMQVFGNDVFWVRLPSVIFSALAAGYLFLAARRSMTAFAAAGVALLFTCSTQFIFYSHEARSYALLLLVLSVSAYFWASVMVGKHSFSWLSGAAFFSALAVYVHYLAFIPVGLILLFMLLRGSHGGRRRYVYAVLLTGLLLLPILVLMTRRITAMDSAGVWGHAPEWTQLYGFVNIFLNGRVSLAVLGVCTLLLLGMYMFRRQKSDEPALSKALSVFFYGFVFFAGYLIMFGYSYKHPVFIERYVQIVMPYFFLFVGACASLALQRLKWAKWLWAAFLLTVIVQTDVKPGNRRNPERVAKASHEFLSRPGSAVLIYPQWYYLNFAYYFDRSAFASAEVEARLNARNVYPLWNTGSLTNWLRLNVDGTGHVMLVDAGEMFLTGKQEVLNTLLTRYDLQHSDTVDAAVQVHYLTSKPKQ